MLKKQLPTTVKKKNVQTIYMTQQAHCFEIVSKFEAGFSALHRMELSIVHFLQLLAWI